MSLMLALCLCGSPAPAPPAPTEAEAKLCRIMQWSVGWELVDRHIRDGDDRRYERAMRRLRAARTWQEAFRLLPRGDE